MGGWNSTLQAAWCVVRQTRSFGRASVVLHFIRKEKRQLWERPMCGGNSTLQAAWYVRHAHWARLCYSPFVIPGTVLWCLWIKSTIWLLILIFFNKKLKNSCEYAICYRYLWTNKKRKHVKKWDQKNILQKYWKTSAVSTTDGWLKLNFSSWYVRVVINYQVRFFSPFFFAFSRKIHEFQHLISSHADFFPSRQNC